MTALDNPAAESVLQPVEPPEGQGTVYTIVTRVGRNAPAAVLDHAAVFAVTVLDKGGRAADVQVPVGGVGILSLAEGHGEGWLRIVLLGPDQAPRLENQITVSLGGTIGILALEVSPVAERRRLPAVQPSRVAGRGSRAGRHLGFYSASSERSGTGSGVCWWHPPTLPEAQRQALLSVLGQVALPEDGVDGDPDNYVWSYLTPNPPSTGVTTALGLAGRPEIVGIEVYVPAHSGVFWAPMTP
jgi:hypothetical protein